LVFAQVIHLVLKRPPDFDYHPGDYVFLNIPCLARFEWHPFTISSAPEKDDVIWLHIRSFGEWTSHLYQYFDNFRQQASELPPNKAVRGTLWNMRFFKPSPLLEKNPKKQPKNITYSMESTDGWCLALPLEQYFTLETSTPAVFGRRRRPTLQVSSSDLHLRSLDPKSVESIVESGRLRERESVVLMPRGTQVRDTKNEKKNGSKSEGGRRKCELTRDSTVFCFLLPTYLGPQVRIDGPYGSSSRHIFRAQHAVLIAAGIGVTPFASILQSIMYRYYQARSTCPRCHHCWVEKLPHSIMKLRKVDFIWINRTQQSLEWFVRMLSDLEMEQAMFGDVLERFLDIHIYITSALDRTDMKAVGLHMALDLLHQKDKRCLITGLKRRTQPGRPNWNQVFADIKSQRKGKVTVFYCGPPTLSRILHDHCNWNHFAFRKEIF
ncbi:unnamed protein product, partial [Ixodes persulcatus]